MSPDGIKHPLRNIFINQRDMIRLLIEQPPIFTLPPGASRGRNTWALNVENIPPGGIARVQWSLPAAAKTVFVQWAWESVIPGMLIQMQLDDLSTGNYIFVRHHPGAGFNVDHSVRKFIGGVETTLTTEAVDLTENSPYEYAFLFDVNRPKPDGLGYSFFHSYRARGDYRNSAVVDDLFYRVRNMFGDPMITPTQISKIDRVHFAAQNTSGSAAKVGILQMHPDTSNPFVIAYDTV